MIFRRRSVIAGRFNDAFEFGYYKATKLFMDVTGEEIYYNNFHYGLHEIDSQKTKKLDVLNGNSSNILITNKISAIEGGSLGKSHLILSNKDINALSTIVGNNIVHTDDSFDFVIELSNILTAPIIEIIKEEFNLNISYSDPSVMEYFDGDMSKVINREFQKYADSVYTNAIFFSFKKYPDLRPCFVWALNGNLFS
ncbi:MAG TPA: hypothetical protein VL443_03875 [Cyclobacteriaceae bacterium]|jgi:hypothetical protein|nr:hypothetical protein [Cyclobacteriaceae bacterium]